MGGSERWREGVGLIAETLKKQQMESDWEKVRREKKKKNEIMRSKIRENKRVGGVGVAKGRGPPVPLICAESIPHCNSSSQS